MFKASLREGTRPHAIKAFQSAEGGRGARGGAGRAACALRRGAQPGRAASGTAFKPRERRAAACPQALLGRPPRRSEQAGAAARLRPALSARPRPGGAEAPRGAAHPARPGAP